jgi:L-ornithine N5-oxygenase
MIEQNRVLDLLGIGFGPSNIALAIALEKADKNRLFPLNYAFIERQSDFVWHGGMLLPDTTMQISFLKDLVTLKDPTSPYTFVNYLHAQGRLENFLNLSTFCPSRFEYNDYLRWVASHFAHLCGYGEDVVDVEPHATNGIVDELLVHSRDGEGRGKTRRTRNLMLAVGGMPHYPEGFAPLRDHPRLLHTAHYLTGLTALALDPQTDARIAVVGGGQSAAEIAADLHARCPRMTIEIIFPGQAFKPADDTPFINEIFDPPFTDFFYEQDEAARASLIDELRNTNYAVVDPELIESLYALTYREKVEGHQRLILRPRSQAIRGIDEGRGLALIVRDRLSGAERQSSYDAVVMATGYTRPINHPLLTKLAPYIERFAVDREYRLETRPDFLPKIWLQGLSEASHGLSDTLLSVLPIRAHELANSLQETIMEQHKGEVAPEIRAGC